MFNKIKNFKETKMKSIKIVLAVMMALISINACSESATNPSDSKDNSLKTSLTSSGELSVENEANALVIKQTEAKDDSYITSAKTGDNQYTVTIKSESQNSEISMVYENKSLFPSKIAIKNGDENLNGDILNYNETEKTFDIIWVDEGETDTFDGIKLNNEIDFSKYESLDDETYQLKITVNTSVISDSIDAYIDENPMARINWKQIVYYIIKIFIAIFS